MRVIYTAREQKPSHFAKQLPLNELLQQADVVSLHCDLNESSANLIGSEQFKLMQKHAILINTARGGIVEEVAAANAIESGQIAGIGFDVFAQEPPAPDHPLLKLADRVNVIITPHIAWASDASMQRLANFLVANIESHLAGKILNLVN
jgi:glycerate dehydrogenase